MVKKPTYAKCVYYMSENLTYEGFGVIIFVYIMGIKQSFEP